MSPVKIRATWGANSAALAFSSSSVAAPPHSLREYGNTVSVQHREAGNPAMRKRGDGSFLISNNSSSSGGRKRMTGQSRYHPRVMMRTLAQARGEQRAPLPKG
jgi:hypothetical protein